MKTTEQTTTRIDIRPQERATIVEIAESMACSPSVALRKVIRAYCGQNGLNPDTGLPRERWPAS